MSSLQALTEILVFNSLLCTFKQELELVQPEQFPRIVFSQMTHTHTHTHTHIPNCICIGSQMDAQWFSESFDLELIRCNNFNSY